MHGVNECDDVFDGRFGQNAVPKIKDVARTIISPL
jgi:hypothetical protein